MFLYLTLESSAHNFVVDPRVHEKNTAAKKGCAPLIYM